MQILFLNWRRDMEDMIEELDRQVPPVGWGGGGLQAYACKRFGSFLLLLKSHPGLASVRQGSVLYLMSRKGKEEQQHSLKAVSVCVRV
jgi:hypothetical protein